MGVIERGDEPVKVALQLLSLLSARQNQPGRAHASLRFSRVAAILRPAQPRVNNNLPPSTHLSIRALKPMKIQNTAYTVGQGIEDNHHWRIRQRNHTTKWLEKIFRRIGQSNAILPAACGRSPPAASGCGPRSRHAALRLAALLVKARHRCCAARPVPLRSALTVQRLRKQQ